MTKTSDDAAPEQPVADATGAPAAADPVTDPAPTGADAEVDALAREVGVWKDKYTRLYAEFDNYKKRMVRERQDAELKGMSLLVRGLLDALDDLGRFAHVDPASTEAGTIVDGVAMVERKVMKSLAGHGLEVVNPVDKAFDPAFHEALTTVPAATKDEDHLIAQVYQVGYLFNGMLLRPARVVVKQWNGGAA